MATYAGRRFAATVSAYDAAAIDAVDADVDVDVDALADVATAGEGMTAGAGGVDGGVAASSRPLLALLAVRIARGTVKKSGRVPRPRDADQRRTHARSGPEADQ